MVSAGYSGTPLARKLGIKEGHRVWLAAAPSGLLASLSPLPSGVDIETTGRTGASPSADGDVESDLPGDEIPDARFDVVLLFAPTASALRKHFGTAVQRLKWSGGLWACWPKKSSALHTDLAREEVRAVGLASGLVDNKVCAVDEDWSGLRFVVRTEDRPDAPGEGGPPAV